MTILVRGGSLESTMSRYLIDAIVDTPNVELRVRTEVARALGDDRLRGLELREHGADGSEAVEAAALIVLIGAHPRTEWVPPRIVRDAGGYVVTGEQAGAVRPLETSLSGVFAAGDVRAGSVKRVAAAVGDGSLAVTNVHAYLAESAGG